MPPDPLNLMLRIRTRKAHCSIHAQLCFSCNAVLSILQCNAVLCIISLNPPLYCAAVFIHTSCNAGAVYTYSFATAMIIIISVTI